jgi:hypothetical protein
MADIVKTIIGQPAVLLLCLGLVLVLLGILGRSLVLVLLGILGRPPLASVPFTFGPVQRGAVAAIGLVLASTGFILLLPVPVPEHFVIIGGTVIDKGSGVPVPDAIVEAYDDHKFLLGGGFIAAPPNPARTDNLGTFYLNYSKDDEGKYVQLRVRKESFTTFSLNVPVKAGAAALTLQLVHAGADHTTDTQVAARLPLSGAALDFSPLRSGQLVVWLSSRPENYSSTIATSFSRDFPAGKLIEREIPPENFVSDVWAPPADQPAPDIAFIDNYAQLKPLLEAKTVWMVWGEPRFSTSGWWVIFKNTKHLGEAQAFSRWLSRAPEWQPSAKNISISTEAKQTVQNASIAALHDLIASDQAALEALLDKDAARSRPWEADLVAAVSDVQPILTFGNSRIAFVLLAVVASGDDFYGMRHMIFIFRNQGVGWRILYMLPDAQMPNAEGVRGIEANPPLLRTFDSLIVSDRADSWQAAAVLVDPPDRAKVPRFPKLPNIAWRSEATADVAFIVESQFANSGDEANWSESWLIFADLSLTIQPFQEQAPFGVGAQPHRWRIWTLDPSGAIFLSPWRTLIYTN